jgi:cell division septum initiation protein DivIVA
MENKMANLQSKWLKGNIQETYSEAALTKALSKYSFEFKVNGASCQAAYDRQLKKFYTECPEATPEASKLADKVFGLAQKVERLISRSKSGLDIIDARKFLCKHLRAMIKVDQELQHAPASERRYELLNSKPIDTEKLSLEDQCLLEAIQEQSEKANNAAAAAGTPDDVTYTVTEEMVQAKMQEKLQQPK